MSFGDLNARAEHDTYQFPSSSGFVCFISEHFTLQFLWNVKEGDKGHGFNYPSCHM
jgi:hypothetical protein